MFSKLKRFLSNYIDSDQDLEIKLLNLFLVCILIGGFCSLIISVILGIDPYSNLAIGFSMVIVALILFIENKFKLHNLAGVITILTSLVVFLYLFFISGGVESGMVLWILLLLIAPFVFLNGKISYILFLICAPLVFFAILISELYPELVTELGDPKKVGIDVAQCMVIVGIIIDVIFKFQVENSRRQNDKIKKSYDEIKKATEAKNVFLSNMSHDIRTPMNAIIGFTRIAKKDIDKKDNVEDCLEKILTSSEYLLTLINDVLDMQKIEQGKTEIEKIKFNLARTIVSIKEILEYQFQMKNVKVEIDLSEVQHYIIENDMVLFKKIIMNLFSNAIKYSKESGGIVKISVSEKVIGENISEYTIVIKDEGKGISKEFIGKMFDPFEREHDTTSSGITGTGLGLSITKSAVDLLGGTIDVTSELGVGTEFTVKINSFYFDEVEEENTNSEEHISFEGKRVLLVEDNELNRVIASRLLQELGFTVDVAENGQEAVDKVFSSGTNTYDLIYMDIMMPVLNGYDATFKIRNLADPKLAAVPIIAMTANAFDEDVKKSYKVGMNGHIAKPISVEELVRVTKNVFSPEQNL